MSQKYVALIVKNHNLLNVNITTFKLVRSKTPSFFQLRVFHFAQYSKLKNSEMKTLEAFLRPFDQPQGFPSLEFSVLGIMQKRKLRI